MFIRRGKSLYAEGVAVSTLAENLGTPLYVYSESQLLKNYRAYETGFARLPHLVCFALKANSNLAVARTFAREGAGADIVSGGELYRALLAGFSPAKIVFSGVGKTREEMKFALNKGIYCFNVESVEELQALNQTAGNLKKKAPVALRVNPDVQADTHHHITTGTKENKFGIPKSQILDAYETARKLKNINLIGIQAHIGSQITSVAPFERFLNVMLDLVDQLSARGIYLDHLDMGGGLGITYHKETPPTPADLARAFEPRLKGRALKLLFEPGRFLVGNAGILVTQVLYRKRTGHKTFVVVDAGMNDLARPALYDAYHEIVPVSKNGSVRETVDVVGPVCESGDYFAKARHMPYPEQGDYLAIQSAGAYGFAMSSQYNSRPRAAEVMVSGKAWRVVRKRESLEDLIRGEK
ncbi:MAG: diaminopimelate decarboxylase [Elusimicrobia bacterium RIFCSPLOWO2_01_FULL_54_10]|nr:MAG: diaminopimelate decarboxylase [Elusimicrobia bacterium RIFCSPLOWO2_01_FULL_54_10]